MSRRSRERAKDNRLGPLSHFWPYLTLALLSFGVYAGTLGNGFVWDDAGQLLKNPVVIDFHKIPTIFHEDVWAFEREQGTEKTNYYRPVQFLVYMAIYYLAGFQAFAFHLLMVLIHAVNTLLVFHLARYVLKDREGALLAAALFAVHPIHTEAVAWIAVLPDVLLTLEVLAALVVFLHRQPSLAGWQIAGHAALYFVALLTKETAVVLPALFVGIEWLYFGRSIKDLWKNRALYASFLGALCIYLVLRVHALGGLAPAQGRHIQLSAKEFVTNTVALMGRYFAKLVWPAALSGYHAFEPASTIAFLLSLVAIIAVVAAMILLRRAAPEISLGLCIIVVPLFPVMNITGVGEAPFAERYLYLPSVGFVCIAGLAWQWSWKHLRTFAWIYAIVILGACSYAVWTRIPDWHDDIRLFSVTARQYPNAIPVRTMLAQSYQFHGDIAQAVDEYRAVVHLDPRNALLHNSLATVLARNGQAAEAIREFETAVVLKPHYWPALVNLAGVLESEGAIDRAATAYERALQIKPDSTQALSGLAAIRRNSKDPRAALDLLGRAVASDPSFTEGYLNLGLVYDDLADYSAAATAFRRAIEVGGQYPAIYLAHYGLAVSYARLNSLPAAADEFARTLQLKPDYAPARQALDTIRQTIERNGPVAR